MINAYYFNLFFTEKEKNIINPFLWKYYPDQINEESILKLNNYYENIILSNLIIIKSLSKFSAVSHIKFNLYDSYQVEIYHILVKFFSN